MANDPFKDAVDSLFKDGADATSVLSSSVSAQGDKLHRNIQYAQSVALNPDKQAQILRYAKQHKVSPGVIERNFDFFQDKKDKINTQRIINKSPEMAKFLENPENMALVLDDIDPLAKIAKGVKLSNPQPSYPSQLSSAFKGGAHRLHSSAYVLGAAYSKLSPQEAAERFVESRQGFVAYQQNKSEEAQAFDVMMVEEGGDVNRAWKKFVGAFEKKKRGDTIGFFKDFLSGGGLGVTMLEALDMFYEAAKRPKASGLFVAEQTANAIPIIAGSAVGSVTGMGTGMVGLTPWSVAAGGVAGGFLGAWIPSFMVEVGATMEEQMAEHGVDLNNVDQVAAFFSDAKRMNNARSAAERKGLGTATFDAMAQALGIYAAGKMVKAGKPLLQRVGVGLAVETVGEGGGEAAGQVLQHKGDLSKVDMGGAVMEAFAAIVQSSGQVVVSELTAKIQSKRDGYSSDPVDAAQQVAVETKDSLTSIQNGQLLHETTEAVNESKTTQRSPEKIKELVEIASGNEDSVVYFQTDDWDAYWNSQGKSPVKAAEQVLKDNGETYYQAKNSGEPFAIPLADYVTDIMPTDDAAGLSPHARVNDPNGMSFLEAKEHLDDLPTIMQMIAKEGAELEETDLTATEIDKEAQQIGGILAQQLHGVKLPEDLSITLERWIRTRAIRNNVSPHEIFNLFPVRVEQGTGVRTEDGGQTLEQVINSNPHGASETLYQSSQPPVFPQYYELTGNEEFVHYAPKKGLTELDPAKMGSGVRGQEYKRGIPEVKRTYYYRAGTPEEGLVSGAARAKYTIKFNPGEKLYDLGVDPDNLVVMAIKENSGARNSDLILKKIKDAGFAGFYNTDSALPNVIGVFDKRSPISEQPNTLKGTKRAQPKKFEQILKLSPVALATIQRALKIQSVPTETDIKVLQKRYVPVTPERFHSELVKSGRPAFLDQTSPQEMTKLGHKAYLSSEGVGFVIGPDGHVGRLFNNSGKPGAGREALIYAILLGGSVSTCFDGYLSALYNQMGFNVTQSIPFDDAYASKDWDYEKYGRPEVLTIEYSRNLPRDPRAIVSRLKLTRVELDKRITGTRGPLPNLPISPDNGRIDWGAWRGLGEGEQGQASGRMGLGDETGSVKSYFQADDTKHRGSISFLSNEAIIKMAESKDIDTWFHETGHYILEFSKRLIDTGIASDSDVTDFNEILKWFGDQDGEKMLGSLKQLSDTQGGVYTEAYKLALKNGGAEYMSKVAGTWAADIERPDLARALLTPSHELWAGAMVKYFSEGQAPSNALRRAFAKFKQWLKALFARMEDLGVKISPEIRAVMDRMYATDEEIYEAQQTLDPSSPTADSLGLTGTAAEAYNRAMLDATEVAEEMLLAKAIKEQRREGSKAWKAAREEIRIAVEAEINQNPDQIALSLVTTGKMPDGTPFNDHPMLMNKAIILSLMDKAFVKALPRKYYTLSSGFHPEVISLQAGFDSSEQMLQAIAIAQPKDKVVAAITDLRMKALHGDMMTDGSLSDDALGALHNDKQAYLLRLQFDALAANAPAQLRAQIKALGTPIRSDSALKSRAEEAVSKMPRPKAKPHIFLRAEMRAAKRAATFNAKGEVLDALRSRQHQIINHAYYRAAIEAEKRAASATKYINSFKKKKKRATLTKSGGEDVVQVDRILERYGFIPPVQRDEDAQTLAAWISAREDEGYAPPFSENIVDESRKIRPREISLDELLDVQAALKILSHFAKSRNKLLSSADTRDVEVIADEMAGIIRKSKKRRSKEYETETPKKVASYEGGSFIASHVKYREFIKSLEGFPTDPGLLYDRLVLPLKNAADNSEVRSIEEHMGIKNLFDIYSKKELLEIRLKKVFVPEINTHLTKQGMLLIALYQGVEDSATKLQDNFQWNNAQVGAILNHLTKKDWEFVQSTWGIVGKNWAETKSLAERVDGVAPEKLKTVDVHTKFGVINGGYFPLKYNPKLSKRASEHSAKEEIDATRIGTGARSVTKHGYRKERVKGVKQQVRLDFGVLFEHVDELINDLTHYEALLDVQKLLRTGSVSSAIIEHHGMVVYESLLDVVQDVATGDRKATIFTSRVLDQMRNGVTTAFLGYSFRTIILQPLGIFPAFSTVGWKWMAKGLGQWYGNPHKMQEAAKWVVNNSKFMEARPKNMSREIRDIFKGVSVGLLPDKIKESYFYLLQQAQFFGADMPIWMGEYNKQMERTNGDHTRSVNLADQQVIDTQGSGRIMDLAKIQRKSAALKLWTNFISYGITMFQRNREAVAKTQWKSPQDIGRMMVDIIMINFLPATLEYFMQEGLRGDLDLDDPELVTKLVTDNATYLMQQVIFFREFSGAIQGFRNYSGPAGARIFAEGSNLIKQIGQAEIDHALMRSTLITGGILFHFPALQIQRIIDGVIALEEGSTGNILAPLTGPPRNR